MKTLMVLGVQEEGRLFARVMRKEPYRIIVGAENRTAPVRPAEDQLLLESGNGKEVLRMAREYAVDGILGIGEAAALAASYAAQQLGLPCTPYAEEQLFHNLLRLRAFQEEQGMRVPRYRDLSHSLDTGDLPYPMYVGPADGAVLRHTMRVTCPEELAAARQLALHWSPDRQIIAQEDIAALGGEGAVLVMTDLVVRGGVLQPILWCEALPGRDINCTIPVGARYPARINNNVQMLLSGECALLVRRLGLRNAQLPVLAYCIPGSMPMILRVGVRDGAYVMTRFLSQLYQHDLLRDILRMAVGDRVSMRRYHQPAADIYRAYYTIPVVRSGILRHIGKASELEEYSRGYLLRPRQSQAVYADGREGRGLGTVLLQFPDEAIMEDVLSRMSSLITVETDDF